MTIYRGPGGTGEARTDTDVTEVRVIADEALGYKNDAAASAASASSSATAAAGSEATATVAAEDAQTARNAAQTAKTAAEAAKTAAEAAQTAAELAETNAETAETNAETAETNAEAAQAAAEAALAAAQAVYDNFDDRYLGAKSSNPTVDNDGNALLTGALYFNTVAPEMRVYNGSAWQNFTAASAVSSFNTRTGAVTLTSTDVNTALGYTAASDSAVVKLTGNQTVAGIKTFSSTISGSISGNAATVTNGVVTTGSYSNPTWITAIAGSKVSGNISGNASNVTGTVAVATGGTGATTASAARTNLGATTLGSNLFTATNVAAISFPRFNADNTISSLDAASFRTAIGAGTSSTTGTVTSVEGTGTVSGITLSGTVTSSGNLTLGGTLDVTPSNFSSQTANTFLAAPNGTTGVPTFRTIVAADVPTLNQNTTGNAATATALSTASGSAPSYSARAWVNFNGTGTVAIRASGNVSSITDNGTGDYTVNFTTAMNDADYSTVSSAGNSGAATGFAVATNASAAPTTSAVRMVVRSTGNTLTDTAYVSVAVFR